MKKYIFTFMLALGLSAAAQVELGPHSSSDEFKDNYTQGIGWIHTPILSNWYFTAEAGPQLYYGYQDRSVGLGDRLTWQAGGYLGRWVFPLIGIRMGAGYGTFRGWVDKEECLNIDWEANPPRSPYAHGFGECDVIRDGDMGAGLAIGGYYHYDDKYTDKFRQDWTAFWVSPDLMINLSYANFYNPKARFTTYAYIGVAMYFAQNEVIQNDPNTAASGHVGLIENIRLGNHWRISADVRFSIYEGQFDREVVTDIEKGLRAEDFGLNLNLGVTYNFNFMSKKKHAEWYREHINPNLAEGEAAPAHLYTTHNVDIDILSYIDTLYMSDTLSEFDPRFIAMVDSLADLLSKDTIDAMLARANCDTCGLRDILKNRMVPYEMVFFELDKWDIHTSEALKIAKMARIMKEYPDNRFLLFGSADSKTGTRQRNEFLSVNRADVVYNKLVYEYDIPESQLQRVYLGGILDYDPYELNRATVIIMDHPKVMDEFLKLRADRQAGGSEVQMDK